MRFLGGSAGRELDPALVWLNEPREWRVDDGVLTITAEPQTDFFRGLEAFNNDSACLLSRRVTGDFTMRALVEADNREFADASCLTVRHDQANWAKVCLERSPIGDLNVVSVVTDGTSDDSTGELLTEPRRWLRISRKGAEFAIHHSGDGRLWRFVRFFFLDLPETVSVGVHVQAPFGDAAVGKFSELVLDDVAVADYRSGD
jgi:regulation of enolase protein 1 (concanavalin A-like superfamily)